MIVPRRASANDSAESPFVKYRSATKSVIRRHVDLETRKRQHPPISLQLIHFLDLGFLQNESAVDRPLIEATTDLGLREAKHRHAGTYSRREQRPIKESRRHLHVKRQLVSGFRRG